MPISMTEQQERDFDEKGFFTLDDFFANDDLDGLFLAIDEVADKVR